MDILVVAAIASLNLQAVAALLVPFLTLLICGMIWATLCLFVFARWLLPKEHWFQLGLINYGMSTGTTASGFVLLRMVDPELKSGAAEDYALAAPLSAPFIGGGMITIALPLLVLERVWIGAAALVLVSIVATMIMAGRQWNRST
jgi:ESS family glutamate:Na+ symporter